MLLFRDRRGAPSLRYRNRAEFNAFMCEQKTYPVWIGMVLVTAQVHPPVRHSVNVSSIKGFLICSLKKRN